MPIKTLIDKKAGIIHYKATGEINIVDMIGAFESVFADPDFRPGLNSLCDAKYADFKDMAFHDVQDLVSRIAARSEERGTGHRVAVLVRGNTEFGLSALFEMQTYDLPFEVARNRSSQPPPPSPFV